MTISSFLNYHIDHKMATPRQEHISAAKQEKVLIKLLTNASYTEIGRKYGFANSLKHDSIVESFKSSVPIYDYETIYNEWWSRSLQGASNVSWQGNVKYFALSSGTSGAPSKYIPITKEMQKSIRRTSFDVLRSTYKFNMTTKLLMKNWLTIGGSATLTPVNTSMVGDLSGINNLKSPFWVQRFKKPEMKIAKLKTWEERQDAIVKNAPNWDISILVGIPSWVQLTLERIVDHYSLDHIHQLWPNLSLFTTGGVALDPYRKSLDNLLGQPIHYLDTYLASEGFFAYQNDLTDNSMKLVLDEGVFYEFVPFGPETVDESGKVKDGVQTLRIDQVEEGVNYALLISTCAGAWRYQIGDTIRFTDVKNHKIIITGRTSQFLSVCGEHLSIENIDQAISRIKVKHNLNITEYAVGATPAESHFRHEWYIGTDQNYDAQSIANLLDEELKSLNDDYRTERSAMLRSPKVNLIDSSLFLQWKKSKGKLNGQSKMPRVIKGDMREDWVSFVKGHQVV